MNSAKHHFSLHPSHMIGCGVAALLVVVAIVFSLPALAVLGAVVCGTMMIAMVWMMVSMTTKGHRH